MSADTYKNQYKKYVNFINKYRKAINAASGSEVDSNANVENKNLTTCTGELFKREAIGTNRLLMINKISELYGEDLAVEYIRQLEDHEIYKHDETSIYPYCVSITMYPYLFHGLSTIGGISDAPKNLDSFCGSFVNLVFAIASQFAGAVATPEFLMYLDYFIRKEFGDNYYQRCDEIVGNKTINKQIESKFQQVVYSLNQPAAARNFQSVFWNLAYFDQPYFTGMFDNFIFPDGTEPKWDSLNWLQKKFMVWFNNERLKKILTFPVETVNLLNDGEDFVDKEWMDFTAEMWSKGHSFFLYTSDSVDSLASCCRLKNEISKNTFSYTLGAGGVSTGSKGVITLNINRLVQNTVNKYKNNFTFVNLSEEVRKQIEKTHKYLIAYNEIIKDNFNSHMLPIYEAGYISLEKQYLTIGINGFVEGAEYLNINPSTNEDYFKYGEAILKPIYELNKADRTKELMFNTEFVPAENLGVKNSKWDKEDGYLSPRDCYNSYFYRVEDDSINPIDKFVENVLIGKVIGPSIDKTKRPTN